MTENIEKSQIEETLRLGIVAMEQKDFEKAVGYFTQAIILSEKVGYHHGVLHGLFTLGKVWKLIARQTDEKVFARLSRSYFSEAETYAKENVMHEEEVIHAQFLLGQAALELNNFSDAVVLFQTAYDYYKKHPRSSAHTGDIQRHLGIAMAKAGDTDKGISTILSALKAIRTFDEAEAFDMRNYVWETGALLALSDVYYDIDSQKAIQFTREALAIANKHNLVIRSDEARRVLSTFKAV